MQGDYIMPEQDTRWRTGRRRTPQEYTPTIHVFRALCTLLSTSPGARGSKEAYLSLLHTSAMRRVHRGRLFCLRARQTAVAVRWRMRKQTRAPVTSAY